MAPFLITVTAGSYTTSSIQSSLVRFLDGKEDGQSNLRTASVAIGLGGEACSAGGVAGEEVGGVVEAEGDDVCATIDEVLLEAFVEFGKFGPVDAGEIVVLEVEADIEHDEVEELREKNGGVADGARGRFGDAIGVLDVHAGAHDHGVGNPVRQNPEPDGHDRIDPERD